MKTTLMHNTTMTKAITPLMTVLTFSLCFLNSAAALEKGTTIIGTKEAPNVLNVVPWQDDEFTEGSWDIQPKAVHSTLDATQNSLDKDVLRREIEYFNLLNNNK